MKKFIDSVFPKSNIKNVRLFYLINGGLALWFVEAIWFFYWGNFADFNIIGTIFASLTLVWIFLEIPSGALADMFGRKKASVFGCLCLFLGSVVLAFAQSYWYLIIGGLIQNVGRAFISGSLEALVYDDLRKKGEEEWFDDVMGAKSRINAALYALSTVVGGLVYPIFFRLPHIFTTLSMFMMTIASFGLIEAKVEKRPRKSFKNYLLQNLEGFKQLGKQNLKIYLLPILTLMVIFYLYDWGFSKPAMALHFGYGPTGQGIIYTIMSLINVVLLTKFTFIREKFGDFKGILALNLMLGIGYVLSILSFGYAGILILLAIEIAGNFSDPWISVIINKSINSQDRATTLSSLEFISKIPFVILIWLSGRQIENNTIQNMHFILGIGLIGFTILFYFLRRKRSYSEAV